MLPLALILASIWGVFWAIFLQWVPLGQFLAERRTWLAVVIGIGVDLLILLLVLNWTDWLPVLAIVATSSLGIIGRSLWNEYHETRDLINDYKNQTGQQDHLGTGGHRGSL